MCESNKINIVVLGDFNRDLLLLPGLSEEKDTKRSFRWYGGKHFAGVFKQARA